MAIARPSYKVRRAHDGLDYDPENPDPHSKRRVIAIGYWFLTMLVAGPLLYGVYTAIRS